MFFLQVSLTVDRNQADYVSDYLTEQGAFSVTFESADDDDECYDAAVPLQPTWEVQKLTALFEGESCQESLRMGLSNYTLNQPPLFSEIVDEDWERRWLKQFRPVRVGTDLWVCPSWMQPPEPEAINLIIDPGLAFGTGTHPTTRLCLEYLSNSTLSGKTVIDYGCGSGILAIAALALGADKAIGIDVDPKSIEASIKNAEINHVESRFCVDFPDLIDTVPGDLVIANILADTLITLYEEILLLTKPGTILLLCGILAHQEQRVRRHYASEFRFNRLQKQDWILLVGTRNSTGFLNPQSLRK